jgi:hypothetical protein
VADENAGNSSPSNFTGPPPSDDGRNRATEEDQNREVKFVERKMSQEKLDSLKLFLKTATADDIAVIRKMYGENIEVLKLIGIHREEAEKPSLSDSDMRS